MAAFDFIASDDLRACLERDSEELLVCMRAGAWKAAHVLAGSLIRATLADYLIAAGKSSAEEALRLPFSDLLALCRNERVLTARTVDLASFLRPYTDFLSPSPQVRLKASTDETSARIAQALLEIVINEIAGHQREHHRYSAEQIVAKLQSDPSASAILAHLITKVSRVELERLIIDVLPKTYFETAKLADAGTPGTLGRLELCYRLAVEAATADLKRAAAHRFVDVLEQESEYVVQCYQSSFFRASDLAHLNDEERRLVTAHLLASLDKRVSVSVVNATAGIGGFLASEEEDRAFFVPLFVSLIDTGDEALSAAVEKRIVEEFRLLPSIRQRSTLNWMGRLRQSLQQDSRSTAAIERVEAVLAKGTLATGD